MDHSSTDPDLPRSIRMLGGMDLILGVVTAALCVKGGWLVLIPATILVCVGWGLLGRFQGARSVALSLIVCAPVGYVLFLLTLGGVLYFSGVQFHRTSDGGAAARTVASLTLLASIALHTVILLRPKARAIYRDSHILDRLVALHF